MASVTRTVYDIVYTHNGIKCIDIANELNIPLGSVSGILTMLKRQGKVFNENKSWYATTSVHTIKRVLIDMHESLSMPIGEWAEGYVTAMVNYGIINENECDELVGWINVSK